MMAEAAANSGTAANAGDAGAGAATNAGQAAANQPWYPDTEKDYVANKGWKGPADVVGSYKSLETLVGADKAGRTIVLPKDEKDAEGIKAFRAKLGVPEAADKYELPAPPGEGGPNLIKEASGWFLEAGIPKAAAQGIVQKWNTHMESLIKAQETEAQNQSARDVETLRGEWGANFDANAEFARRFLTAAGWDDAKMAKYERAFGSATMLKDFFQWGKAVAEPGFSTGGNEGGNTFSPDKQRIQSQIQELTQKRIANQITQPDFLTQNTRLQQLLEAAR